MRLICRLAWGVSIALLLTGAPARAQEDRSALAAETLVRTRFYEGVPYAAARDIDAAGAARLVELLADPAERRLWPRIVVVLGIAAQPGAFEAIAEAGERGSSGEVDRAGYELAIALPLAMGHLARRDDRALDWLRERALARAADPGWSHGAHAGQPLADELRRAAVTGLAVSARPEALETLATLATPAPQQRATAGDPELAASVAQARALHARVASEGPDAVFAGER